MALVAAALAVHAAPREKLEWREVGKLAAMETVRLHFLTRYEEMTVKWLRAEVARVSSPESGRYGDYHTRDTLAARLSPIEDGTASRVVAWAERQLGVSQKAGTLHVNRFSDVVTVEAVTEKVNAYCMNLTCACSCGETMEVSE